MTSYVCGYTRRTSAGRIELTDWRGKTILACRSTIFRTYPSNWVGSGRAIGWNLGGGRWIIGYALDDSGMLFRGELYHAVDDDDAEDQAGELSRSWRERDYEDEQQFDADLEQEELLESA